MARSSVELIVDASKAVNPLKRVTAETKKLENATKNVNTKLNNSKGQFAGVGRSATQASKGVKSLNGAVGKLLGLVASFQTVKFVLAKTAELETQTRSLKVLTGSLRDAQKIIKELQAFGAITPFTSSELIETAKRLKAFGFETEKIVDVTKRLSDIAGATGADLSGIATAFGQIQAKGRLQGEELLQLQERGVDLQGTLRKEYGLTAEEFQKALSKGRIGADAVNFALVKLTEAGGKYADGAIAQSDTLSGKFSTLVDGVETIARSVGEVLQPAIKGVLGIAIDVVNSINAAFNAQKRLSGFGISDKQRSELFRQAGREAEQIAKLRGGGKIDSGEFTRIRQQRFSDLINQFGFDTGQLIPEISAPGGSQTRPELGAGTVPKGGGARTAKERVDMTQKLFDLNQRLREQQEAGNEREVATLQLMIKRQEIAESNLLPLEQENKLQEALHRFRSDIFAIDKRIADQRKKDQADAAKALEDQMRAEQEAAQKRLEADPAFQMKKQLEELLDVQNQVQAGAVAIGNAFANSFKAVVTGSKSGQEALADMMSAVAEHFMNMATQIIAQQLTMILYGTIMKALGVGATGGGGFDTNPLGGLSFSNPVGFANGGFVDKPTKAIIGEGSEPEYVIPESKMRESMARYSRGSRGDAVIPGGGAGDSGEEGGVAASAPIDVRYTVERINSVDYVTADQFQSGMQQAAAQGAKQGEQQTLKRLQMSGSTRKRIGL